MTIQEVFEKRGYIVIGCLPGERIGTVLSSGRIWMNFAERTHFECPLVIVAKTDVADFIAQEELMDDGNPWGAPGYAYYRVVAE